jgi:hypothetical protein
VRSVKKKQHSQGILVLLVVVIMRTRMTAYVCVCVCVRAFVRALDALFEILPRTNYRTEAAPASQGRSLRSSRRTLEEIKSDEVCGQCALH